MSAMSAISACVPFSSLPFQARRMRSRRTAVSAIAPSASPSAGSASPAFSSPLLRSELALSALRASYLPVPHKDRPRVALQALDDITAVLARLARAKESEESQGGDQLLPGAVPEDRPRRQRTSRARDAEGVIGDRRAFRGVSRERACFSARSNLHRDHRPRFGRNVSSQVEKRCSTRRWQASSRCSRRHGARSLTRSTHRPRRRCSLPRSGRRPSRTQRA